jgi:hypothetical protein
MKLEIAVVIEAGNADVVQLAVMRGSERWSY